MACECQKPCNRGICCSECIEANTCEERCQACAPKEQVKEEPKNQKED